MNGWNIIYPEKSGLVLTVRVFWTCAQFNKDISFWKILIVLNKLCQHGSVQVKNPKILLPK